MPNNGTPLVKIRISPQSALFKGYTSEIRSEDRIKSGPSSYKSIQESSRGDFVRQLTRVWGRLLADAVRNKMAASLSIGGGFNIGATDTASSNISVALSGEDVRVVEGNLTDANQAIRTGVKPGRMRKGDLTRLRQWAGVKGVDLNDRSRKDFVTLKRRTRKNKTVFGAARGEGKRANEALWRVWWALQKYGSDRAPSPTRGKYGSNWWDAPPVGQGRFDYPKFAVESQWSALNTMIKKSAEVVGEVVVETVFSGQKYPGEYGLKSIVNAVVKTEYYTSAEMEARSKFKVKNPILGLVGWRKGRM